MDTLFIAESLIQPFKFWHNQQIATGMHFRNELFGQLIITPIEQRQQFFQKLDQLSAYASDLVITASSQHYRAWVNLRSPLAASAYAGPEGLNLPVADPPVSAPVRRQTALPQTNSSRTLQALHAA